jgi:peptide/nickel transport system permease protein
MDLRSLLRYWLQRLLIFVITIWGSFTIAFIFFRMIPGDPIQLYYRNLQAQYGGYIGEDRANAAAAESLRARLGYEGTPIEQYFRFLYNIAYISILSGEFR